MPGRVPVRPNGNAGDRPVDGASGANDWTGSIPFDELPRLYNPPDGIIVTANNAVVDAAYPHFLGKDWDPAGGPSGSGSSWTRPWPGAGHPGRPDPDPERQAPVRVDSVIPAFLPPRRRPRRGARPGRDPGLGPDWRRASRGCAAYEVAEWRLQRALFEPWVGAQKVSTSGPTPPTWRCGSRSRTPAARSGTAAATAVEKRDEVIAGALDAAGADRRPRGRPAWSWGRLHRATFRDQTLGKSGIAPVEGLMNAGPFEVGGTADAVNNVTSRRVSST